MRAWFCDTYQFELPPGHRFPISKYRALRELLLAEGVLSPSDLEESAPIGRVELGAAHDGEYLAAVFSGASGYDARRVGLPWSEGLVRRSCASVSGTVAAARRALEDGIAGNLGGGTHHAFADHGEGFCVFNDLAVAARLLQREGLIERALIVDLDVHQGNGTAAIFADDPSVFTFSMHGAKNFPFRKQRSCLDVELADGCGDSEYLAHLARHMPAILAASAPQLVFFQAGVDPLGADALGRLSLTRDGLLRRDRIVLEAARAAGVPVVLTLGGGYARPIELSVEAHAGTWVEARRIFGA